MPEPRILLARTVSDELPPSPEKPRPLRVLSVHSRALNLMDESGEILAVVTPEVGDGPFHIVLERTTFFDFTRTGQMGLWRGAVLTLGDVHIDWRDARPWRPHLASISIPEEAMQRLQTCVLASQEFQNRWEGMGDITIHRIETGKRFIARGMMQPSPTAFQRGVMFLMGLGPGLTPAGDDYLLGALARLQMDASLESLPGIQALFEIGAERTTKLSRAWLQHAAQGRFAAHWHALGDALMSGRGDAICGAAEDILRVGATSGPQALAGFLLT